ncbi:unnamed protein product [Closterium sp. NIES-65]|nr:unnamed protein product [Closterium sp. NIES-65]
MAIVGAVAAAAGAAAFVYYTGFAESPLFPRLRRRKDGSESGGSDSDRVHGSGGGSGGRREGWRKRRRSMGLRGPDRPPATLAETAAMLAAAVRFLFVETLGKWPLTDLLFGVAFLLRRRKRADVSRMYAREAVARLRGAWRAREVEMVAEYVALCYSFSRKPYRLFLEDSRLSPSDVLLYEPKAGLLKPAFAVIVDGRRRTVLVVVRGTHSTKDKLTCATGAVVPFHHTIMTDGGVRHIVLGYAHCGMVAAARAIAARCLPTLRHALARHPGFHVKVIGHSLGGATASLLTFILREKEGLASTTCVAFGPAAAMTWELAQSGECCVTSIVNGTDFIPTLCSSSLDDLRQEVRRSAWASELREQLRKRHMGRVEGGARSACCSVAMLHAACMGRLACGGALRPSLFPTAAAPPPHRCSLCAPTSCPPPLHFLATAPAAAVASVARVCCHPAALRPSMASTTPPRPPWALRTSLLPPGFCSRTRARPSILPGGLAAAAAGGGHTGSAVEGPRWWRQDVAQAIVVGDAKRGVESRHGSEGRLPHTLAHAQDMRVGGDGAGEVCAQGAADGEVVLVAAEPQKMVERGAGRGGSGSSAAGRDAEDVGKSAGHVDEAGLLGVSGTWVKVSDAGQDGGGEEEEEDEEEGEGDYEDEIEEEVESDDDDDGDGDGDDVQEGDEDDGDEEEGEGEEAELVGEEREQSRRRAREEELRRQHSDDVEGLAALLKAMDDGGDADRAEGEEDCDDSFLDAVGREGEASFPGDSWRGHSGGLSWAVMEQQLQERLEASTRASKSEEEAAVSAAVVQDILREEEEVASQVAGAGDERDVLEPLVAGAVDSSGDVPEAIRTDPRRWFPCGRMVHLLRNEDPDEHREDSSRVGEEQEGEEQRGSRDGDGHVMSDSVHEGSTGAASAVSSAGGSGGTGGGPLKAGRQQGRKRGKWKAGMFETPRHVYSSIKLTGSMIQDHLMMNYRRTLLDVARELEQDDEEVMDEEYDDDDECTFNCG